MRYTVTSNGLGGCGHRHRSREAAERCLEAICRSYARLPGGNSYYPGYVVPADDEAEAREASIRRYESHVAEVEFLEREIELAERDRDAARAQRLKERLRAEYQRYATAAVES